MATSNTVDFAVFQSSTRLNGSPSEFVPSAQVPGRARANSQLLFGDSDGSLDDSPGKTRFGHQNFRFQTRKGCGGKTHGKDMRKRVQSNVTRHPEIFTFRPLGQANISLDNMLGKCYND